MLTESRIIGRRDPGKIHLDGERISGVTFEKCALSMTGASSRSSIRNSSFERISGLSCTVGHAVFERCRFRDIEADDTLTIYEALFVECIFEGYLRNMNFGRIGIASPFFSPERLADDLRSMELATYCLDISSVSELKDCAFIGDAVARRVRFRHGQGLILRGDRLDVVLEPLLTSTNDADLAALIAAVVGFGSTYRLHFCPVPFGAEDKLPGYIEILRELGVEVIEAPLC